MGDPLICYVTLDRVPPLDDVVAAIRATPNAIITPGALTETPGHFVDMPGGPVLVLLVPMSLPEHMLEDDMAQRVAWPDWQTATRRWQSHLIVSTLRRPDAAEDARERAGDILALSASLATRLGASGVGWAGSNLFVTPDDLTRQLAERTSPVEVLVRCIWRGQPRPKGQGMAATTRGLRPFGVPEVNHLPSGEDAGAVYDRLMNLSTYLLIHGPVLNIGDTIGVGPGVQGCVAHNAELDEYQLTIIQ